ncbi:MAG TPA: diguanylate cyclase [Spirochaetota bacterium]|nr:diguanylate cyclase [Spirochaetota bacterium]HOK93038.1 diguanylate cyclase [Spirochaetota bacterium]HPP95646.1 diguanylate cyclase [Spirochaetota bacterium]
MRHRSKKIAEIIEESNPLVMIVEDNPINSKICQNLLEKNGYSTAIFFDGESALKFLSTCAPDLILLDIIMPGMDGFQVSEEIKKNPKLKDTPIIFLSAMNDEESIVNGFKKGGVDYITKPFRPQELLARTKTHVDLKRAKEKLLIMATTDELTGLYNRRYFIERLNNEFERFKRFQSKFSFLMIDIDLFKNINDNYGHKCGDLVLQKTSEAMRKTLRSYDILARVGGEEFAIILPETDIKSAETIAERLRKRVYENSIQYEDIEIKITISIGVTQSYINDKNIDDIIVRADKALYISKEKGRNSVTVSTEGKD